VRVDGLVPGLLVLVVVAALLALVLARRRRTRSGPARVDPLRDGPELYDPHRIGVADVVTYAGVDHVVRGTITLTEGGSTWKEHLLDGSTGRRWLTVEDDEGDLEMTLWMRREMTGLEPTGSEVVLDDRVHRLVERGRADYTAEGTTGTGPQGAVDYADYATADRTGLLAFERWASTQSWEVSTGRAVTRGELTVFHSGPPTP
jgi:hypothetical protein